MYFKLESKGEKKLHLGAVLEVEEKKSALGQILNRHSSKSI